MSHWLDSWRLLQVPRISTKKCFFILLGTWRGSVVYPGSHSMIGRSKIQTRFLHSLLRLLISLVPGEFSAVGEAKTCRGIFFRAVVQRDLEAGMGEPFCLM